MKPEYLTLRIIEGSPIPHTGTRVEVLTFGGKLICDIVSRENGPPVGDDDEQFRDMAAERVENLRKLGFKIEVKTPYHFRVNGRLDVFHVNRRWHDIEKNERGDYRHMEVFVKQFFARNI